MSFSSRGGDRGVVSLRQYDGTRLLNSPTSLRACQMEGVLPQQLVKTKQPHPPKQVQYQLNQAEEEEKAESTTTPGGSGQRPVASSQNASSPNRQENRARELTLAHEKALIRHRLLERERQALLQTVKVRFETLLHEKEVLPKPASAAAGSPAGASSVVGAIPDDPNDLRAEEAASHVLRSSKTRPSDAVARNSKSRLLPDRRELAAAAAPTAASADDLAVAELFLVMKKASDEQGCRLQRWREKEARIAALNERLAKERHERVERSSRAFEERLERAKRQHEQQQRTQLQRTHDKMATLDGKIQQADTNRKHRLPRVERDHGAAEFEAAQRRREEQLQRLRAKIERATATSRMMQEKAEHDRALKSYEADVITELHEQQLERFNRMTEFRKEQISRKVEEDRARQQEAEQCRAFDEKVRCLRAERIAREKEEVTRYIEERRWQTDLQPPEWLEPRIAALQQKRREHHAGTAKHRPRPPPPLASHAASGGVSTARGRRRQRADGDSSSDRAGSASRAPCQLQERFTLASPRISEKQTFPKWMFE